MNHVNQTTLSFTVSTVPEIKTYDRFVAAYSAFVDKAVRSHLNNYKEYCQAGGKESFFKKCWWQMMNETVEEAERVLRQYASQSNDAKELSKELQRIAEERLLHINELAL
ncbi:MAG: hypothetical protein EOO10_09335 [Chitinophagaceae bacterium]|nr:MAG: hypothetical protein EOO10_09335 [Chitinophagaceae bacterium]